MCRGKDRDRRGKHALPDLITRDDDQDLSCDPLGCYNPSCFDPLLYKKINIWYEECDSYCLLNSGTVANL